MDVDRRERAYGARRKPGAEKEKMVVKNDCRPIRFSFSVQLDCGKSQPREIEPSVTRFGATARTLLMTISALLAIGLPRAATACDTTTEQRLSYPPTIAIAPSSLARFHALKPDATYGVIVLLAYRDGRLTFKTAGHADVDDAFRTSLTAFGWTIKVTPIDTTCGDTGAGAWLMIFTIPDGRVILFPIPLPTTNDPIPLPRTGVGIQSS